MDNAPNHCAITQSIPTGVPVSAQPIRHITHITQYYNDNLPRKGGHFLIQPLGSLEKSTLGEALKYKIS